MFNWLKTPKSKLWSRRTRWTPLLLNQRQFQRVLSKERVRADRTDEAFGFIILRLTEFKRIRGDTIKLAKLLHRRLRETDEKGHLGKGRLGVVLPATDSRGTELVLESILDLALQADLKLEGESFVYPNPTDSEPPRRFHEEVREALQESRQPQSNRPVPVAMMVGAYPTWKRALDIAGASFGLVLASPIMVIAAAMIRLTSPGPILFHQQRMGYLGQQFTILKLRTMVSNAEELKDGLLEMNERDGPAFKMKRDPRITTVGRLLRSTGLDELPQFLNVLRGDMSLVGPRPLPVSEDQQCLPWQRRRLDTKPGLTCFWQLSKSRNIPFVEWMRLDMTYEKKCSLWLDLKLIAKTFSAVLMGRVGH